MCDRREQKENGNYESAQKCTLKNYNNNKKKEYIGREFMKPHTSLEGIMRRTLWLA